MFDVIYMDLYSILEIVCSYSGASKHQIDTAYRKLAKKYHPDLSQGKENDWKRITAAYNILSDPEKMARYINPDVQVVGTNTFRYDYVQCEGYWASSPDKFYDTYVGLYPWPEKNDQPWHGEAEFIKKLNQLQNCDQIDRNYYMGVSNSRFEKKRLGCFEYILSGHKWTEAFCTYYVGKFHVRPSASFYQFVMNYKI